MTKTLLVLSGDGIGPEVCAAAVRVAERLIISHGLDLRIEQGDVGGASYDKAGVPLTQEVVARAKAVDAVLLGAVGGPRWDGVARDKRPEAGLLGLRQAMGTFANLRPAFCFDALASASTLKPEIVSGLDLIIVRELVGGVYFGQPRGIETLPDRSERGFDTQVYTTGEIERVARVAFEIARGRRNRVTSVEKSNVMESGVLWRRVVSALGARDYPDVELEHMYADNCAMQLIRAPRQFDVILTDNLFGDILSDAAAMATGSLGMLPSASLAQAGSPGLFEPVHGSAPDIAGQGVANPSAAILALAMALRWSLARPDLADLVHAAVAGALRDGAATRDLGGALDTDTFTDRVLVALGRP